MEEFDQLHQIWKTQHASPNLPDASSILQATNTTKGKLTRQVAFSCFIFLSATVNVLILQQNLTVNTFSQYALVGLGSICLAQSLLNGYLWYALRSINELQPPATYAQAWSKYFTIRKKIVRFSGPVYFVIINFSLITFFIEVFAGFTLTKQVLFVMVYTLWVLVSWFIIRRKVLSNEYHTLTQTIQSLKSIAENFQSDEPNHANDDRPHR